MVVRSRTAEITLEWPRTQVSWQRASSSLPNRLRQPDFGPVETDEVKPRFALDRFTDHASLLNDGSHGIFNDLLLDFDRLDRMFHDTRLWIGGRAGG